MGTLHPFYEEELEHVTWAGDTNQGVAFKTQLLMAQLQPVTEAPCTTDVQECGALSCCHPPGDAPKLSSCCGLGSVPGREPSCVHGTQRLLSLRAGA